MSGARSGRRRCHECRQAAGLPISLSFAYKLIMDDTPFHPEDKARSLIDRRLAACGWLIQSRSEMNLGAGLGIAVREFQTASGPVDYGLFVGHKLCGVIEAKAEGSTLSGFSEQASRYIAGMPKHLVREQGQVRFEYVASGSETIFRDHADPDPASRRVFTFHRPDTLERWLKELVTLRARLQAMPAVLTERSARLPDRRRVSARTLAGARPSARAGADGDRRRQDLHGLHVELSPARARRSSGASCFWPTAPTWSARPAHEYRGLSPARHRAFVLPKSTMSSSSALRGLDKDAEIVVATIQRVYSVLTGRELLEEEEEASSFETVRERYRAPRRLQSVNPDRELRSHRHRRMPSLDLRHLAAGAGIFRRIHGRPDRNTIAAYAAVSSARTSSRNIPMSAQSSTGQRRLRDLSHPHRDR